MHLFFLEKVEGSTGWLDKEESHHAERVLKMKAGDEILVSEGKGKIYHAHFTQVHKNQSSVEIGALHSEAQRHKYLHIAIGPTKTLDRFEYFLEKATEAGVDEITPIISFHSERKVYKTERGRKIIRAAVKQSLSPLIPRLNEAVSLENFMRNNPGGFIAHCREDFPRRPLPEIIDRESLTVLIGPEGDFSDEEIRNSLEYQYEGMALGSRRLRTETAGVAVALMYKMEM